MKISKIEAIPFFIPFKPDFYFPFSMRTTEFVDGVLVRVYTDTGVVGISEAPSRPYLYGETPRSMVTAVVEKLAPSIIGMNPFDVEKIHYKMDQLKQNPTVKAAIDIALHDILGQVTGVPVYRLLGGWNEGKVPVSWMMGIKQPDEMAKEAQDFCQKGFKAFKIKAGLDPQRDLSNFRLIREAVGKDIVLYIDANQAYSPYDAIQVIKGMEEYGIAWVEEPVPIGAGARRRKVAEAISVPILGDESCFTPSMVAREIEDGVIGLVLIKVARTGFYQSRKIVHLCEQAGIPCLIGSQGDTSIGTIAALHVAKAFRQIKYPIENSYFLRLEGEILKEPLAVKDGCLEISDKPGLGIEIDEKKLEKYRVRF